MVRRRDGAAGEALAGRELGRDDGVSFGDLAQRDAVGVLVAEDGLADDQDLELGE